MRLQADITTALIGEQNGALYCIDGNPRGLEDALVELNVTSLRVALFSDGSQVTPIDRSLAALARFSAPPLEVFLCLHCSDVWADPSHQAVPVEWSFRDRSELRRVFAAYLTDVLTRVAATGARVCRIQIGNEVTQGFLWPFGRDWDGFAELYGLGAALVRGHFPDAQLVLHTDLGGAEERALRWYEEAERRRIPFDAIGLSYYPVWHGDLHRLEATLDMLARRFDRPIVIAETGYMNTAEKTSAWFGDWIAGNIAYADEGQPRFVDALASVIDAADGCVCRDVFWWGAFAHRSQEHFPMSWFDRDGRSLTIVGKLARRPTHG
jgi:arabinogalactan endo-1,4-beta-galactosidase